MTLFASDEINLIRDAIQKSGAKWQAAENWVTKLSIQERRQMLGQIPGHINYPDAKMIKLPAVENIPVQFDWRNNNGNWVTPVRNQGDCGSCWDFSAVAQIEAWWKIHNNSSEMPDLSEQIVLSCGENGGCEGDAIETALDFAISTGIPPESYLTYQESDDVPCSNAVTGWQSEVTTIPGWGYITMDEENVDNIKNAVYYHPVSAAFEVYSDFYAYDSGVYEYTSGTYEGGHAILIVGWDDEAECWICKNSWGEDWGESGFFRIKWGECNMGTYSPFIYDEIITTPSLTFSPDNYDITLTSGDSAALAFVVKNSGTSNLVCSAVDYASTIAFHIDDYGSFDGSSWWCGDTMIGGYDDHWLQYLETPMLDLSTTTAPVLTWKGKWALEDAVGAISPYDGWDGCNVWISTDGGRNFSVISPNTPAYNCTNLYSFADSDEGWDLGSPIPGWGGTSGGWVDVQFDLSAFRDDSVVIRWALASDLAYSTSNDAALTGFFVDNISVSEGSNLIFQNNGSQVEDMLPFGLGGSTVEWATIASDGFSISPDDSIIIEVQISTRGLNPGDYSLTIMFISNDITKKYNYSTIHLKILTPEHDLAIADLWLPSEEFPIMVSNPIGLKIINRGTSDETNFKAACTLSQGSDIKISDTVEVDYLSAGAAQIIQFTPLVLQDTGFYNFKTQLLDCSADIYLYNNSYQSTFKASNFIDGFENDNGFWDYQGGWGPTTQIDKHSGNMAAHVNSGVKYLNNMDASLQFIPGIIIKNCEYATLKFWSIFQIEENKDFCYVELSSDTVNWTKAMTLTGFQQKWKQFQVSLNDFIAVGDSSVWVRFHFVSNESGNGVGILIDDVTIYPENITAIMADNQIDQLPSRFHLRQNFPNPFNPVTKFTYELPRESIVELSVYNFRGQLIEELVSVKQPAGVYSVTWNADHLPSGIYFYRLSANGYSQTKKCVLLK